MELTLLHLFNWDFCLDALESFSWCTVDLFELFNARKYCHCTQMEPSHDWKILTNLDMGCLEGDNSMPLLYVVEETFSCRLFKIRNSNARKCQKKLVALS